MKRALCIGHLSYDITLPLEGYPIENTKYQINQVLESSGGPAANAAALLSLWGIETTFLGTVGRDSYGERALTDLQNSGVNTRGVLQKNEYTTPLSIILVNTKTGSRTIINRRGMGKIQTSEITDFFNDPSSSSPDLLLFDGHEPDASLAALESFPEAVTILDAGSLRRGTELLAPRVDFCIASERFAREVAVADSRIKTPVPEKPSEGQEALSMYGALLIALKRRGIQKPVITLGERGCCFMDPEVSIPPNTESAFSETRIRTNASSNSSKHSSYVLFAYPANTVDTTGAGDVFHGAFSAALLWNKPFREALIIATVAAGLSVERLGGRTSIPKWEEVKKASEHWVPKWQPFHF
ncbi:MAG: PfkB family carbohydrate kinase [Spirochaetes bacterium]|nr:PfkB family carbohydrate kinase [Spirochaetota bacterium]